jgi:hypothetical protein
MMKVKVGFISTTARIQGEQRKGAALTRNRARCLMDLPGTSAAKALKHERLTKRSEQ